MDTVLQEIRQRKSQPVGIVPVIEPLDNDIDPLEAFRRLNGQKAFLLESAETGGKSARYSFVGRGRSLDTHRLRQDHGRRPGHRLL